MKHVLHILAGSAVLLSILLEGARVDASEPTKPNVVFILADDWGWGDLSCHGSKVVDTPHLDGLAAAGMEFHQFNTCSPVCSPSRTAFMTGHFPARHSVHEAIGAVAKNRETGQADWVDPRSTMLPRLFKEAGYATGHFGKWHLSGPFDDAPLPPAYGFDEHAVWTGPTQAKPTEYGKVFDDAIGFLRTHKSEPFYLNVWIHQAHLAHHPSAESMQRYAALNEQQQVYSAVIADGDTGIGKILTALKELGIADNTLVVFSSDNGPENTNRAKELRGGYGGYYSVGSTGGLRGRKRSLYEGGVRLPFIVRWPRQIPAGVVNKTTSVAAVDLLPTVCELAGVALPTGYQADGESIVAALKGAEQERTKPIFWDWRGKDTGDDWPRWAVRDGDWKLVADNQNTVELYRLSDDRSEQRNLAQEHPEIVKQLLAKLITWRATLPQQPSADCLTKAPRSKRRNPAAGAEDGRE